MITNELYFKERGRRIKKTSKYRYRWNYSALASRQVSIYWLGFYLLVVFLCLNPSPFSQVYLLTRELKTWSTTNLIIDLIDYRLAFKRAYWIIQRFLVHYQILHLSNIGLFSFSSYKVIALPTIATALVVALKDDREEER